MAEGCYGDASPLNPAWIPVFAGMTIWGVCASLGWRFDTAWKAGIRDGDGSKAGLQPHRIYMGGRLFSPYPVSST